MSHRPPRKPSLTPVGDVLSAMLKQQGIGERITQATAVDDWAALVGPQIAAVTTARSVTADGVLWVHVKTAAWMTELSLLAPELLAKLNAGEGRAPIRQLRFRLGPTG
jgi:predicted nucleic acid-binding Zn ribbon protein